MVSTLALAAANAANAQVSSGGGNSYDAGDPVVVSGNVSFDRQGTANTETYTINSNTAVLDFIPNDTGPGGPINFQFAGTLAQYLGGLGITDFTVLNRILAADPSRAIQLNGTIISRLQASPTAPGGSVWFYSPGGIVVGSSAVIDVGNLLLATGDPTGGEGVIADPNQFTINSVADSNAAITVQAGAQITASNPGSYIALVAPAITQSGTVSTNGSAAYVAAEQTTLTFNSGLFNIQTTVGSNANNNTPLVHDGTTRFIDDSGQRRAYLVSVAKNDAITMLIEGAGQLGFDMATGVNIDNGVVVLSGGYDVNDTTYTNLAGTAGALRHDIQITNPTNNANFQGQVNPFAASEIRINSLGQAMNFAGDVSMNAGSLASIATGVDGSVNIAGDVDLSTLVYGARDANFTGGNVVLDASLGNISIGGNTSLTSFVDADFLGGMDPAGTVTGGTILVSADNGNTVNMLGNLNILVEANGADQLLTSQTSAGNAIGGNIVLASSGGSSISVSGVANIVSTATGGTVQLGDATAGNATGGTTNILAGDGNIAFGGDLSVSALGVGGRATASGAPSSGDGTGGTVLFNAGTGTLSIGGNLTIDADGNGGSTVGATNRDSGDGTGGTINLTVVQSGGLINIAGNANLSADGRQSNGVGTGNAGNSTGGNIFIAAAAGSMNFGQSLAARAEALSGSGADNAGVLARGGNVSLISTGGAIAVGADLFLGSTGRTSNGIGTGTGGARSNEAGGNVTVQVNNSGVLTVMGNTDIQSSVIASIADGNVSGATGIGGNILIDVSTGGQIDFLGNVSLTATATGGGHTGTGPENAGSGTGGQVQINVDNAQLNVGGTLFANVTGTGGNTGFASDRTGGNGVGGDIFVGISNNGLIDITGAMALSANGNATSAVGSGNSGGNGIGGTIRVTVPSGLLSIGTDLSLDSRANAGSGADNTGVLAQGGMALVQASGGTITNGGQLRITTSAFGGSGGAGQDGADAIGGSARLEAINGGTINTGSASISAGATGGSSNGGVTGLSGNGVGGSASVLADTNGIINIAQSLSLNAAGFGGSGLVAGTGGGDGTGGLAEMTQATGGQISIGTSATLAANGNGGVNMGGGSGIGGAGLGGQALLSVDDGTVDVAGNLTMHSFAFGGNTDGGIAGGSATGNLSQIRVDTGALTVGGDVFFSSAVQAGAGLTGSANGGDGIGGDSIIQTTGSGSIAINGNVTFHTFVNGFATASGVGTSGGHAVGGAAQIIADTGTIAIGGSTNFESYAFGGSGDNGGDGQGGDTLLSAQNGGSINIAGSAFFRSDGIGGSSTGGGIGGIGTGGRASIFADSTGTINLANQVTMNATGRGGQSDGVGNKGGFGQGGTAEIFAHGTINIVGDYFANTGGIGGQGSNGADGGDALGGVGSIIADGGLIRFDGSSQIRGSTVGGNIISGSGSGGNAQGGLGEMIARNGGNLQILGVNGIANIGSSGFGGDGLYGSGSGGNAIGGTSNVIAESGGTIDIAGFLLVTASGLGGREFFDPNVGHADLGGDGTGGTVNILANGGNIVGTSNVAALANGQGGLGVVQGGTGTGGTVNVQAIDGLLDFSSGTDEMFLSMSGFGGDAVAETDSAGNILRGGGNGGDGIGGNIFLISGLFGGADDLTGILRIGDLRISENAATPLGLSGIGGAGAAGVAGQDGGDGGDAFAGVVRIGTNNGSSQLTAGNITVGNRAIAGIGGDGENGGDGGDAFGRQTSIGTFSQLGANTGGSMTVGNIAVNGSALAGNGGAGLNGTGGIGGDSLVGAPELFTTLASAFLIGYSNPFTFNDAVLTMDSTGGDGGMGTSGRAAGGTAAGFGGGILSRRATDGVGSNGQVFGNSLITQAISTGGLGTGDVRAASNRGFALLNAIDGNIFLNNATLTDGGLAPNQDNITSYIRSGNGFVEVTGLVNVNAAGDFGLFGLAGGDIELDSLNVVAGGTILFDDPRTPGSTVGDVITINTNATAVLGGDFTIGEDIILGGLFDLTAAGSINTLGITAGAGINLQSGGTITTGNLNSLGDISLTAMSDETLGLPASIATGNITSQAGLINVVTNIGDITLGNLTSSNAITINAGNGSTNVNAGGDIVIGAVQGSSLSIFGTDDLTIGGIDATQSIDVTTTGLASFNGIANAPFIAVTSGDINFGTNGGLGVMGTEELEINARAPDQPIIFGGDGSGGGYNLSASEATKLRSRTIRFNAQQVSGAAPADITIRDFTMQGSLAGSSANLLASDLFINSPGNIRVTGAIRIENAGAEDGLFLSAQSGRIEVVTDMGGSIALVDGAGGLGGNLYLDARHIAVGKEDLLTRLAADPRFAGRDAEVNAPDGSNRPEGYISANSILADGFETIIIQNSGTDALRGGFSAGTGGFLLNSQNMTAGAVDAVINGRVADGSGGFLTNDDSSSGVTFENPAPFSAGSTVNGCLLDGGGCPVVEPPTTPEPSTPDEIVGTIATDVREIVQDGNDNEPGEDEEERAAELTPAATGKKSPIAPNIPVVNTTRLSSSPTVTDPITGSGNPNLIGGELEVDPSPSPGPETEGDF